MDNLWREVEVDWKGERSFIGRNAGGGTVQIGLIDGKPGVSPMEMILLGVAGCTGIDVANILTKARQPLQDLRVQVRGKFAPEGTLPRIYTDIEVTYLVWGNGIDIRVLEGAIELSMEKYCSASAMVKSVARVTTHYQILAPNETPA